MLAIAQHQMINDTTYNNFFIPFARAKNEFFRCNCNTGKNPVSVSPETFVICNLLGNCGHLFRIMKDYFDLCPNSRYFRAERLPAECVSSA